MTYRDFDFDLIIMLACKLLNWSVLVLLKQFGFIISAH